MFPGDGLAGIAHLKRRGGSLGFAINKDFLGDDKATGQQVGDDIAAERF